MDRYYIQGDTSQNYQPITCIVGTCHDDSGVLKRASVSLTTIPAGIFSLPVHDNGAYQRSALMSLEGIFRPYSVNPSGSGIGRFEAPSGTHQITSTSLNPFGSGVGQTDIDFITSRDTVSPNQTIRSDDINWYDAPTARGIGFKLPMVGTGWGYDINDRPVPGNGTTFSNDYRKRSDLWKTGPIDLRWDPDRKVWTGGNTYTLAIVMSHSGTVLNKPGYVCRPCSNITNTFNFPDGDPMGSGTGDVHVCNIQDATNGVHTIGAGQLVMLYRGFGIQFMNENSRSLIEY